MQIIQSFINWSAVFSDTSLTTLSEYCSFKQLCTILISRTLISIDDNHFTPQNTLLPLDIQKQILSYYHKFRNEYKIGELHHLSTNDSNSLTEDQILNLFIPTFELAFRIDQQACIYFITQLSTKQQQLLMPFVQKLTSSSDSADQSPALQEPHAHMIEGEQQEEHQSPPYMSPMRRSSNKEEDRFKVKSVTSAVDLEASATDRTIVKPAKTLMSVITPNKKIPTEESSNSYLDEIQKKDVEIQRLKEENRVMQEMIRDQRIVIEELEKENYRMSQDIHDIQSDRLLLVDELGLRDDATYEDIMSKVRKEKSDYLGEIERLKEGIQNYKEHLGSAEQKIAQLDQFRRMEKDMNVMHEEQANMKDETKRLSKELSEVVSEKSKAIQKMGKQSLLIEKLQKQVKNLQRYKEGMEELKSLNAGFANRFSLMTKS